MDGHVTITISWLKRQGVRDSCAIMARFRQRFGRSVVLAPDLRSEAPWFPIDWLAERLLRDRAHWLYRQRTRYIRARCRSWVMDRECFREACYEALLGVLADVNQPCEPAAGQLRLSLVEAIEP